MIIILNKDVNQKFSDKSRDAILRMKQTEDFLKKYYKYLDEYAEMDKEIQNTINHLRKKLEEKKDGNII